MGQSRRSSAARSRALVTSARGAARGTLSPAPPAAAIVPATDLGVPDKAVSIVNCELLEAEAKRVLSAGA